MMRTIFTPINNQGSEYDPTGNYRDIIIISKSNSQQPGYAHINVEYNDSTVFNDEMRINLVTETLEDEILYAETAINIEKITITLPE